MHWGPIQQHVHRSQHAQAGPIQLALAVSAVAAAAPVALIGLAAAAAAIGAAAPPAAAGIMVAAAWCLWRSLLPPPCRTTAHGSRDTMLGSSPVWLE